MIGRNNLGAPASLVAGVALAIAPFVGVGCDDKSSSTTSSESSTEQQRAAQAESDTEGEQPSDRGSDDTDEADDHRAKADQRPEFLTGSLRPGRIMEVYEAWRERMKDASVHDEHATKLADVPEGATVTVYLGTWCPDSRREVTRFWKALETAGGDVPFSVEYVGLDTDLEPGEGAIEHDDVNFVPTFVVERDGEEVGRIVEAAPHSIEKDLHALLAGEAEGPLSATRDL